MAYTTPTVNYCATVNGTYTSITGVQSVSINRGRQRFQDNFPQSSCVIELIPAASYALPFAIGQFIDVRDANTAFSPAYFVGVITDVERKYAIPYNSSTGLAPADRIIITATGATGALGAASLSGYALPAGLTVDTLYNAAYSNNVYAATDRTTTVLNSAQTFTGGAFDLINGLLKTLQWFIDDWDNNRMATSGALSIGRSVTYFPQGRNGFYSFSDNGTIGSFKYSDLQYLNSVQNSFTEVQVVAPGLATQTESSGTAPFNTLVYNTYNASTSDANSLAGYVLQTQSSSAITPYTISTNTNIAPTCISLSVLAAVLTYYELHLGEVIKITFRGTTVDAVIQGINTTFYPDYATVQMFLAPSLGIAFILNSSTFGVLDTNRLGYP